MPDEIKNFVYLSKYAGSRFDIVQAGGGNTSAKLKDGTMYVKASGVYLSEVNEEYGYACVRNNEVLNILNTDFGDKDKREKDKLSSELVNRTNLKKQFRPSIETFLHSMLGKYVLHSHPIAVNSVMCRSDWKEVIKSIFGNNVTLADYKTPGLELAKELQMKYNGSKIIFLQNHGLIVHSDNISEVINITEEVLLKTEKYLNIDIKRYKLSSEIFNMLQSLGISNKIAYLSEDISLKNMIDGKYYDSLPFCPDKMVYCGYKAIKLNSIDDIKDYKSKYFDIPRVLTYKGNLFFIADNTKKAKEIEEVFKFHLLSLHLNNNSDINYLSESEIGYIANWEAEKYRQSI